MVSQADEGREHEAGRGKEGFGTRGFGESWATHTLISSLVLRSEAWGSLAQQP